MSIALIVTRGYANGTLTGTIKDVVTRGYSIGEDLGPWTPQPDTTSTWQEQTDTSGTWNKQVNNAILWTKQ